MMMIHALSYIICYIHIQNTHTHIYIYDDSIGCVFFVFSRNNQNQTRSGGYTVLYLVVRGLTRRGCFVADACDWSM